VPKKKKDEVEETEIEPEEKKPRKGSKKKKKASSKEKVPTVDEVLKDLDKEKKKKRKTEEEPEEEPDEEEEPEELDEEEEEEEEEEPEEEKPKKKPEKKWSTDHLPTKRLMMMANATPFGSLLAYLSLESKRGVDREMVRFQIAQNIIVSLFTFWWLPVYAIIALIAIFKASSGECWEMPIVGPWAHYWVDREDLIEE
jgi:uncharacterized membrane protein